MMMVLIILLTLILFIVLAMKSDMLRDHGKCKIPEQKNPFSLSRVQLAMWSCIIFCSYIYLMTITEVADIHFTEAVLTLMGISVGTTVVSNAIDHQEKRSVLKNKQDSNGCSMGFIRDILSDESGMSVYRFQQVLFSALLIYVFIHELIIQENFPELDNYLLIFAGISSGGYLGIKMNE